MDKYELYAKESEREAEGLIRVSVREFIRGEMTEEQLKLAMRKAFKLGHNAGHCRGEGYKRNLREEII